MGTALSQTTVYTTISFLAMISNSKVHKKKDVVTAGKEGKQNNLFGKIDFGGIWNF